MPEPTGQPVTPADLRRELIKAMRNSSRDIGREKLDEILAVYRDYGGNKGGMPLDQVTEKMLLLFRQHKVILNRDLLLLVICLACERIITLETGSSN